MVFLLTTTATSFDSFVKWPAEQTYIYQLASPLTCSGRLVSGSVFCYYQHIGHIMIKINLEVDLNLLAHDRSFVLSR